MSGQRADRYFAQRCASTEGLPLDTNLPSRMMAWPSPVIELTVRMVPPLMSSTTS